MIILRRLFFIVFFMFLACSDEPEQAELLYDFPSLSQGQLIDLKKTSETIENFLITTDLSDLDSSWAERGLYLYICIRFLNDPTVNTTLNKSAIPLLIQASHHKDKPTAESIALLHPKTIKPDKEGIFYYEEKKKFNFVDSSIMIRNKEYDIFDVNFNSKGRVTHVSFIQKGAKKEDLDKLLTERDLSPEGEESEEESTEEESSDGEVKEDLVLTVTAFAKQFNSSCNDWAFLNYKHTAGTPDYLQYNPATNQGASTGSTTGTQNSNTNQNNKGESSSVQSSTAPENLLNLIPEEDPHTPVDQSE